MATLSTSTAIINRYQQAYLEEITPVGIAQVAATDLGRHVPAAERGRRKLDATAVEQHRGHHRHGVPSQVQLREPLELRVAQRHLQDQLGRIVKVVRIVPVRRHHQRQDVPLRALALPAKLGAKLRSNVRRKRRRQTDRE